MRVLVFNCGTDSIRFKVIDPDKNIAFAKGGIEAITTSNSYVEYYNYENKLENHKFGIELLYNLAKAYLKYYIDNGDMQIAKFPISIDAQK